MYVGVKSSQTSDVIFVNFDRESVNVGLEKWRTGKCRTGNNTTAQLQHMFKMSSVMWSEIIKSDILRMNIATIFRGKLFTSVHHLPHQFKLVLDMN